MTIYAIPTSTDPEIPAYVQRTTLDGRDYGLTFQWNARDLHWYLSIADADGAPIVTGVRLVLGMDPLRRCADPRRPPGALLLVDVAGLGRDPGLTDLGAGVFLCYYDAVEVGA